MNFVILLVALSASVANAESTDSKGAVPNDADQKAALAIVADVYKPDYEKAKTPAQKLELAKKLLGEGIATKDDSVSRFVLFRIARDIAAQQGDLVTAFDAIGRINAEYDADALQMKVDAAAMAVKTLKLPKDHQTCAVLLTPLIDEAIAVDSYEHAKSLATLALGFAREGRDSDRTKQVVAKFKEVEEIAAEFEKVKEAKIALEARPTDPAANFAVGKFLCFVKGDWRRGVTMLALSENVEFKAAALLELEKQPDSLKVGDAWWKIAEGLEGTARERVKTHAADWYRKALPGLSGLTKARVEKLLKQIVPDWEHLELSNAIIKGDHIRLPPNSAVVSKEEFSGPIEITIVTRTEAENIRIHAFRGAVVIFNWEVDPKDLRVHRPDGDNQRAGSGSIARARTTPLSPNTWYTLRWRITAGGMQVFVNDKQVFSEARPTNLSVKSRITVQSKKSIVDVKEFAVRVLDGDR